MADAKADSMLSNWEHESSKVPPGWDGICCSNTEYFERLENWLGYTELVDKPGRIGPAILARLIGKPRLIAKQVSDLTKDEGYKNLIAKMKTETKGQDEDEAYREIKRFHALFTTVKPIAISSSFGKQQKQEPRNTVTN